ncbi:MAG: hypothetical protein ACRDHX_05100 [Chloroflexota bacterium]
MQILIDAMMQNTQRHVHILQAIDQRMRRSMASWVSALPVTARNGRRLGPRQNRWPGGGLLAIVFAGMAFTRQPTQRSTQSVAAVAANTSVPENRSTPSAAADAAPAPNPLAPQLELVGIHTIFLFCEADLGGLSETCEFHRAGRHIVLHRTKRARPDISARCRRESSRF